MLTVNKRNNRIKRKVCSNSTIGTSEQCKCCFSCVFMINIVHLSQLCPSDFIVNFENVIVGWAKLIG